MKKVLKVVGALVVVAAIVFALYAVTNADAASAQSLPGADAPVNSTPGCTQTPPIPPNIDPCPDAQSYAYHVVDVPPVAPVEPAVEQPVTPQPVVSNTSNMDGRVVHTATVQDSVVVEATCTTMTMTLGHVMDAMGSVTIDGVGQNVMDQRMRDQEVSMQICFGGNIAANGTVTLTVDASP